MTHQLIYVSTAMLDFKQPQLLSLLLEARSRNQRLGITGMLMFCEGNFIQVLEGTKEAVQEVFASIQEDRRHTGIIIIEEREVTVRTFAQWTMGFAQTYLEDITGIPGYEDIDSENFRQKLADSECPVMNLLKTFERYALKASA